LKSVDRAKDQTYFLHRLDQRQLERTLFPVGHLSKSAVRAIAREQGIPTYAKKDSTGICFIGERPFRDFLARYLPRAPGAIETPEGTVVGRHQGLAYYTLGQRQGLGIGGKRGADAAAWFVAGKDAARNVLKVVQGHDDPRLHARSIAVEDMHWIASRAPASGTRLGAKIRYRMADAPCRLDRLNDGSWRASFDTPQWAPAPGQYLVVYEGEVCLGGGVISATEKAEASVAALSA
jgi:tRNA-specific 2-thiouridylase